MVVAIENNLGVGLDIHLDEDLIQEGCARELVNRVQNMRKDAGLEVTDRIRAWIQSDEPVTQAVAAHRDYIAAETLALELDTGALPADVLHQQEWQINGHPCTIGIARA